MKKTFPIDRTALTILVSLAIVARPGSLCAQQPDFNPFPTGAAQTGEAQPEIDINRDIQVTPAQGKWMVCVASYTGADAPQKARELVTVLRGPKFNLAAYVFNYGAEERRKELERKKAQIEQQRKWLEQIKAPEGTEIGGRIVVRTRRIEEQCAVLVGGYTDMDNARRALEQIRNLVQTRNLKPADFGNVTLNWMIVLDKEEKSGEKKPMNPFKAAFVVHNPAIPMERPAEASKLDVGLLRTLNSGESFSLLSCRKPLTLVVAQYWLPSPLEQRGKGDSFLGKIGLGNKSKNELDPAAIPAHNLAEWLRKGNIESYVLHTKNASIVTVGSYDSLQDPRLATMKERWANMSRNPQYQMLNLFPQAVPMEVPR
jgi:hypothetical protein